MRILVLANMYPTESNPARGTFVKDQVDSLREAGLKVDLLLCGPSYPVSYAGAAGALRQSLRQKRYDVVHAHYGLVGVVGLAALDYPVVVTYHGGDLLNRASYNNQPGWKVQAVLWGSWLAGLACAERIVVAELLKPKLWPRAAVTIPMGIDLNKFKPVGRAEARQQVGLPPDKPLVLFPAHPANLRKRFDVAQAAVRLVQRSRPAVELVALRNVPHEQMPLYMSACDVMVQTSMYEASPTVVKEALACNLPVVSVDVGDVGERIRGVAQCFLCERTPADVAAKVGRVLDYGHRPVLRPHIEPLSLPNVARRVVSVYERLLN